MQHKVILTKKQSKKLGNIYKYLQQHYPNRVQQSISTKNFSQRLLAEELLKNFFETNHKIQKKEKNKNPIQQLYKSNYLKKDKENSLQSIHATVKKCSLCFIAKERGSCIPALLPTRQKEQGKIFAVVEQVDYFSQSINAYFMDEAGQLLKKILQAVNISLKNIYYTSLLKCTGAVEVGTRLSDADICLQHTAQEINYFNPKLMLIFGENAYKLLLPQVAKKYGFNTIRGKEVTARFCETSNCLHQPSAKINGANFINYSNDKENSQNNKNNTFSFFNCIFTHHPKEIIRDTGLKREVWNDLKPYIPKINMLTQR